MKVRFELCKPIGIEEVNKLDLKNYIFEIKYDGERNFIYTDNNRVVSIENRRGFENKDRYSKLKQINIGSAILDTEVCYFVNDRSQLNYIQQSENWDKAVFVVFDILKLNGKDLRSKPLMERKEILQTILQETDNLMICPVYNDFTSLWKHIKDTNKEGVILKNKYGKYVGFRSGNWLKLKNFKEIVLEFNAYEVNNKGITLKSSKHNHRVALNGIKSDEVMRTIDSKGSVRAVCQFLRKTDKDRYIQITFKEVYNGKLDSDR